MALYLKSPDSVLTPDTIFLGMAKYVLEEFNVIDSTKKNVNRDYLEGNGEKLIQKIIDNSDNQFRMYGTARELAENIRIFKNFPGSHTFFGIDSSEPYNTTPIVYRSSEKNEKYFAKPDLFVLLQNMILHIIPVLKPSLIRSMIAIFLKSQEKRVSERLEFVRFDPEVFGEIEKEIEEYTGFVIQTKSQIDNLPMDRTNCNMNSVLEKFKKLIPIVWNESESWRIYKQIEQFWNKLGKKDRSQAMTMLYTNSKIVINCLQNIIKKRPEMFLPYSETRNNKMPVTVRVFEDGTQKFVMGVELFRAIHQVYPESNIMGYKEEKLIIKTIAFNDVQKHFEEQIKNIEFIRTPILRAKHKAVPIQGLDSEFCILAVDYMFHVLKNMAFAANVSHSEVLKILIDQSKKIHFIKLNAFADIEKNFDKTPCFPPLHKKVRDVKANGFTVDELKDELRHLELSGIFPDIIDHAEIAYAEVMRVKKEKHLRTCDLFDAIEHCQLICIFNKYPRLLEFLHNQKGCGRLLTLVCDEEPTVSNQQMPNDQNTIMNVPSKYKRTTWKFYDPNEIRQGVQHNIMLPADYYCEDGLKLYLNQKVYFRMINVYKESNQQLKLTKAEFDVLSVDSKLFYLDEQDFNWTIAHLDLLNRQINCQKFIEGNDEKPFLHDIESFSKFQTKKKFYIRTVSSSAIKMQENRRVFAEEIIEILPIILKQQGNKNTEKLHEYEEKWIKDDGYFTLSLPELKKVLEELDIDKRRFSLIPDHSNMCSSYRSMLSSGDPVVTVIYAPDEEVMDSYQAIFGLFQSIVCDIDWNTECCKQHPNCMDQFKTILLVEMKRYYSRTEKYYVSYEYTRERIKALKSLCNYTSRRYYVAPPMVKLFDCDFKDSITLYFFLSECEYYGLNSFQCPPNVTDKQLEDAIMPVWKARILFMLGWIDLFFGDDHQELKDVVREAMLFRSPYPCYENESDLMDLILCLDEEKQTMVHQLSAIDTVSTEEFQRHEWIRGSRRDRKYILMGQFKRWNEPFSLEILRKVVMSQKRSSSSMGSIVDKLEEKLKMRDYRQGESSSSNNLIQESFEDNQAVLQNEVIKFENILPAPPSDESFQEEEEDSDDDGTEPITMTLHSLDSGKGTSKIEEISSVDKAYESSIPITFSQSESSSNDYIQEIQGSDDIKHKSSDSEKESDILPAPPSDDSIQEEEEDSDDDQHGTESLDSGKGTSKIEETSKPMTSSSQKDSISYEEYPMADSSSNDSIQQIQDSDDNKHKSSDSEKESSELEESLKPMTSPQKDSKVPVIKVTESSSKLTTQDNVKVNKMKRKENNLSSSEATTNSSKPSTSSSQKESKTCEKCFRTSEILNETRKELKTSQNKVKNLAKKISGAEKNIAEEKKIVEKKEKEIENLKKELAAHSRIVCENREMKLKISKMEIEEAQLNQKNEELDLKFNAKEAEWLEKVTELNAELDSEKQVSQQLWQEGIEFQEKLTVAETNQINEKQMLIDERRRFEEEIQEKTRQINEFHESTDRLKAENEMDKRTIQQLLEQLNRATVSAPMNQSAHQPYPHYPNIPTPHPMQPIYIPTHYNMNVNQPPPPPQNMYAYYQQYNYYDNQNNRGPPY